MTGIDTNILVQLCLANHPGNKATLAAVQQELQAGNVIVFTASVVAEFLHVITDSRRFTDALSMTEALDWVDEFLQNSNSVQFIPTTEQSARLAMDWIRKFQLGRKRLLDTNLAAAIYVAGGRRIVTSNPNDFAVFNVLEVICP
jgi:predicted nucleic acid-binding protein